MITFRCGKCGRHLRVGDELAGQKVKCPGCGQVMLVPAKVQAPAARAPVAPFDDAPTLPPAAGKAPARPADLPTDPPPSHSDLTNDPAAPEAGHDSSLTSFLAPPQADDELGRLGGFRILKILGHGGMGVVFQGEDPKLGRKVAIKAMLPHLAGSQSAQQRFLREAKAAAALEHDHIVPIFHVGEDRGAPFIVMPFLKGEPLDRRLQREGKLPVPEILRIGREVARGLAAAHAVGLIHRDIKPANIWLEAPEARVKILDFGLARASQGEQHLTQSGAILGTPSYMAPEQAQTQDTDSRADLFSLGVVLYRLCTGVLPFRGHDTMSTLLALATHSPAPPRAGNADIPPELSELVMKLLEKQPARRLGSAQEVIMAIQAIEKRPAAGPTAVAVAPAPGPSPFAGFGSTEAIVAPAAVPVGSTQPGRRAAPARRSRRPLLVAVGGALVAAVAVTVVLLWPRSPDSISSKKDSRPVVPVTDLGEALPRTFTNKLGMEFVLVPKGKSWLGGGGGKPGDKEVEIKEDFYLGKYEVTQEEWAKVMGGAMPSYFSRVGANKDAVKDIPDAELKRFPVETVSWDDAQLFLKELNKQDRQEGWVYRLPMEVEWEYACRGGPMSDRRESAFHYYLGKPTDEVTPEQANYRHDKWLQRPCKVGSYKPNKLGLYDMHNNILEWCADEPTEKDANGLGLRALRGGCWNDGACGTATRFAHNPSNRHHFFGLRVIRVPVDKYMLVLPTFKNRTGMEFVMVPKGKAWLGGGSGKPGTQEVEIKEDFYLGKYEVTQEEWAAVMGALPSWFSRVGGGKDAVKDVTDAELNRFPVEQVSWEDAQLFVKELNKRDQQEGWVYRLPKEAEWEYACRGGPMSDRLESVYDFYLGKPTVQLQLDQANFTPEAGKGLKRTCKVGSYRPNKLGLHDMHGNVQEWCDDSFDPKDQKPATPRVIRGGCWHNASAYCQAAFRDPRPPSGRDSSVGLRLARVPVGAKVK
jgi:formylglycine-generating enzyme required for sulfatase activity